MRRVEPEQPKWNSLGSAQKRFLKWMGWHRLQTWKQVSGQVDIFHLKMVVTATVNRMYQLFI